MVLLLHREDFYERSPRDFIVAKHRNGPTARIAFRATTHGSLTWRSRWRVSYDARTP